MGSYFLPPANYFFKDIYASGNITANLFIGNGSLLTDVTATIPDIVSGDIRGNIIGNYANMYNIIGVIGNVGNTQFTGGNVAVSGQINVLGNVVASFYHGNGSLLEGITATATIPSIVSADIRGNIIGNYANMHNVVGVIGNIGNTQFTGGNVAISGQINVLGNVVAPFFIGDHRGNIIGDYANVIIGNIGNTRFVGGNVMVSGQVNVTGNVAASFYRGNGSLLEGITTTLPSVANIDIRGNVTAPGNIIVAGQVNVTGNVTAGYFLGNGSLLEGITATLPAIGNSDINGNIIGNYANMHDVVGITGNIGNARFSGGNVAVSGQINVLGNVVAPFLIGDIRGNVVGDYANVITGNIGNTRFVGGNIAVSGQINVLGNVIAPFHIGDIRGNVVGDIRGNIIGDYANVITGNIGNTRFVGGNIAVSGQINVLGNVWASFFRGNGSLLEGITATATIPSVISADINGNIIGNYANMHNIVGVIGNIGNTRLVGGNVAVSGQVNVLGNVVARNFIGNGAFLEGLPSRYLSAIRSTNQKITEGFWGNINIIMNSVRESAGITYNSTTGIITLEGGVTYRITAQLAFSGTTAYNSYAFRLVNSSTGVQIGQAADPIGANASTGNTPASVLDLILTPSTTTSYRLRMVDGLTVGGGEELRSAAGTFLTIVGLGSGFTTGLPTTGNIDMSGNIIGNYANMHNVIGIIGNIGNTRFEGGNVAVSGQVNVNGQIVALGNIWASFFRGNGSLLEGITATLPAAGNSDISGNIIGNYADMHNVVGVIGNIGNTRFAGGNIAVSGQINVLGNVVAPFHIGDIRGNIVGDVRGNIIGDYANVITGNIGNTRFVGGNVAVNGQINALGNVVALNFIGDNRGNITGDFANVITGNIGNTRFVGGNVAVSGQINVLGNVVTPFLIGDIRGNIIGDYANVITGNIGNTRFVGGNVAVSGQINVLGNIIGTDGIFSGNVVATRDIRGRNTMTLTCAANANVLTVSGTSLDTNGSSLIQVTTLRGNNENYSMLRLDNAGGTLMNVNGNGEMFLSCPSLSDALSISSKANSFTGTAIDIQATRIESTGFNFIKCRAGAGATTPFLVDGQGGMKTTGNVTAVDGIFSSNVVALNFIGTTGNIGNVRMDSDIVTARTHKIIDDFYITTLINSTPVIYFDVDDSVYYERTTNTYTFLTEGVVRTTIDNKGNLTASGNIIGKDGIFTGNVIASGNVTAADGIFSGNVVATRDIRGSNTMTITCAANANILTVTGSTTNSGGASLIQAVSLRGNVPTYSLLRLDNIGGRLLDVNGNGEMSITCPTTTADMLNITGRTSAFVGNAINIVVPKLSLTDYSFINCRNTNGPLFNVDGRGMVSVTTFVNSNNVVLFANSSSGYVSDVLRIQTTFAGASGWNVISARNSGGNVFRVNGVGGVFGVGAYNTSGADYAEMFEWEDGNKLGEDRRGTTVIIGNNGAIRIASLMDNPIDVIGVVSVNPSVLGDTKWNEWSGRYLRDKFGAKLSNTLYYISNVSNETERVRCGINDTPPDGYEKIISSEHIENPNYDPNINYTSRENRSEWSPIGLVGKLRVLPGQIVNPGWKLLKTHKHADGDTLEYLVK